MITILINAYAINPNWGSEPGMGWNWIIHLAQYCRLHVITEGEWREEIELALLEHPQKDNITFYYSPMTSSIRRMCWAQGDWRFYWYYRLWQKQALKIARRIIEKNNIDIIHQLNMIGFREPGYLWKIKSIPFVWGPIGGMENVPLAYLKGAGFKQQFFVRLKNILNWLQFRFQPRVRKAIRRANALIAAVNGVKKNIEKSYHRSTILLNETGCHVSDSVVEDRFANNTFDIMWVGKFDFRKQLGLALSVMKRLSPFPDIKLHVYGNSTEDQRTAYKKIATQYELNNTVIWHGEVSHKQVLNNMKVSNLFLFTSIMEGTPHVILEAIENNLPVICFDCCGMGAVIDDAVGTKIPISSPEQSIIDFSESIKYYYYHRDELSIKSSNCALLQDSLSWDKKARQMVEIYKTQIINSQYQL